MLLSLGTVPLLQPNSLHKQTASPLHDSIRPLLMVLVHTCLQEHQKFCCQAGLLLSLLPVQSSSWAEASCYQLLAEVALQTPVSHQGHEAVVMLQPGDSAQATSEVLGVAGR
jgi:hypothetical protein